MIELIDPSTILLFPPTAFTFPFNLSSLPMTPLDDPLIEFKIHWRRF